MALLELGEVADAAVFLDSHLAKRVTGHMLVVDAGHMLLTGYNHDATDCPDFGQSALDSPPGGLWPRLNVLAVASQFHVLMPMLGSFGCPVGKYTPRLALRALDEGSLFCTVARIASVVEICHDDFPHLFHDTSLCSAVYPMCAG
ncbi:hypothetical protein [Mycobacterium sp. GA-2829]|uniref:hypothetical protein n=1 Tax=Mycobacterium sp. GA-2829 TaxID=1772283 RepID=UPI00073FBC07|nr:hypothetical protein [Mycobacterium sp. GA-2829]KUI35530.1 hypothetical protein AU194_29865 [Mycobacterium sp. GA-2829]